MELRSPGKMDAFSVQVATSNDYENEIQASDDNQTEDKPDEKFAG